MPRRIGASLAPRPERWTQGEDGWYSSGRGVFRARKSWATRKRRKRIGHTKASHKANRLTAL